MATGVSNDASSLENNDVHITPSATAGRKAIDDIRPLKVAVIGAGLSGVIAGSLLPAKVPRIQLTIFEKNAEVVRISNPFVFPRPR
jgi:ribulose 1,5-bisphosphate synthetase/thiazole synthase